MFFLVNLPSYLALVLYMWTCLFDVDMFASSITLFPTPAATTLWKLYHVPLFSSLMQMWLGVILMRSLRQYFLWTPTTLCPLQETITETVTTL